MLVTCGANTFYGVHSAIYVKEIMPIVHLGDNDWPRVLSEFSNERVKEGLAPTTLSFYLFNRPLLIKFMIGESIRNKIWAWFPKWMTPGSTQPADHKMSKVYEVARRRGMIEKSQRCTNKFVRGNWEKCGLDNKYSTAKTAF